MIRSLLIAIVFGIFIQGSASGDIISTSGNIHFDTNSDNANDFSVDGNGLGIGTSASSNLHVIGNGILDGEVFVNQLSGNSTLEVTGSLAFLPQSVSGNISLEGNTLIFADTASTNLTLNLLAASLVKGRQYTIKKINNANKLIVQGGGNIDGNTYITLRADTTPLPHLVVQSDGSDWQITSLSGNGDVV